ATCSHTSLCVVPFLKSLAGLGLENPPTRTQRYANKCSKLLQNLSRGKYMCIPMGHLVIAFAKGAFTNYVRRKLYFLTPSPLPVSRLGEVSPIDNTLASSAHRPPPPTQLLT